MRDARLEVGRAQTLRMTVVPDEAMGNDTMTDSVEFGLGYATVTRGHADPRRGLEATLVSGESAAAGIVTVPELIAVNAALIAFCGWLVRRAGRRVARQRS
jgi:hypothetical protein